MSLNQSTIKEITESLLKVMDFQGEVLVAEPEEGTFLINIESSEAPYLIGYGGQNLQALRQIIRAIIGKKLGEAARVSLDVNQYYQNHFSLLQEMAHNLAKEAMEQQEPRWLSPMNSYERRMIHLSLIDFKGIKTESEGEGEERRVVIRPDHG